MKIEANDVRARPRRPVSRYRDLAADAGIQVTGSGTSLAVRTPNGGHLPGTSARPRIMLAAMRLSTFMVQIDVTIVNIALPRIQSGLGTSAGNLEWVISAYALTLATLIPISGVLGDRFGRKRLFMIEMAVFAIGSVLCALAPNALALIVFRVVQGVGGGTHARPDPRDHHGRISG